jgi:hypothetical protein
MEPEEGLLSAQEISFWLRQVIRGKWPYLAPSSNQKIWSPRCETCSQPASWVMEVVLFQSRASKTDSAQHM